MEIEDIKHIKGKTETRLEEKKLELKTLFLSPHHLDFLDYTFISFHLSTTSRDGDKYAL